MNKVEAWKAAKHGFDVWGDLVRHAGAGTPMAEIDEPDLERMKWYGVFYRKRVEDGRYMIRVRIPGCELTSGQARAVGAIARAAYSIVDVTTRGNVQVQGLTVSQLVQALGTLEATGLTAKQTGHDNVRNVMCHPLAGVDPTELVDARPLCRELTVVFLGDRVYSSLPRKFNVAVDGRAIPAPHCYTQDVSYVAARRIDGSIAYHWLLGGTQGQNPRLAWKPPLWVTEEQAPEVFRHSLAVFNERGSREKRDRARLRYLIEGMGLEAFTDEVQSRLGYRLDPCDGEIPEAVEAEDFIGWFAQKQPGLWALGISVPLGRLTAEQWDVVADLSDEVGDGTLRMGYDQGVVVPNIAAHAKHEALRRLNRIKLSHEADSIERNLIACTGRQFCNIAVSETKGHAYKLMDELRSRGVKLGGIKINMSGCPSSCAQTYTADIGLKGVRVRRPGGTADGFDVFLGGGIHGAVELGLPYKKGVDVGQLPGMVAELIDTFEADGEAHETFSAYWRSQLIDHKPPAADAAEYRPETWVCDLCDHHHRGEDPPTFCPKCAALRKHFARLGDAAEGAQTVAPTGITADGYHDAGSMAELAEKGRIAPTVEGRELAIFLVDGVPRAIDGLCPHEGGPLAQGDITPDGIVTCPWHDWTFRVADGAPTDGNPCVLKTYLSRVANGRVQVALGGNVEKAVEGPREHFLKVREVIREAADTLTIRLCNGDGAVALHRPGQHLKVGVDIDGVTKWKSFTISSPPTRADAFDLTVKLNPGGVVSPALHASKPGDTFRVKAPAGGFVFDPEGHKEPLVFVVAGSGITPAMSILRYLRDRQLDQPATLFYGSRGRADVIFADELEALRLRLGGLKVVQTLSSPDESWRGAVGRVGPELLSAHLEDPSACRYYICGPGDLRESTTAWLRARGVDPARIHSEVFGKAKVAHKV